MKNLLLACGILIAAAPAFGAAGPDDPMFVVAKVNGEAITRAELTGRIEKAVQRSGGKLANLEPERRRALEWQLLDVLVTEKVMEQAVKGSGVKADEAKINETLAQLKKEAGSEGDYSKALEARGLTEEGLKEDLRFRMGLQQMIEQKAGAQMTLAPDAAQTYYNEHPDFWKRGDSVAARHILVLVKPEATEAEKAGKRKAIDAALARVTAGEDFGAVAREVSEDPGTNARGGQLPAFTRGQMVPEFEKFAFALKPGQISPVFSTQYGFHFLEVTGSEPARTIAFDEAKVRIEQVLQDRKRREIGGKMVQEIRKAAKIEIFLPGTPPPQGAAQDGAVPGLAPAAPKGR